MPNPSPGVETRPREQDVPGQPVESELARFFAYSHDVLAVLEGSRVFLISPSVERVLGHTVETVTDRSLLRWVHPEDRTKVKPQARALFAGGPVSDMDVRILAADRRWVPMRWSLSLGPHRRVYAVGRDRTDEARRQEALLREEIAELRLRTSMELHDGILQTLTGASLQIEVARRLIDRNPQAAREVLRSLADSVSAEQREIRLYADEVKGTVLAGAEGALHLQERIETIIRRVGMIWNVETSVDARATTGLPPELGRQILRIIQEATVNAARHGGARTVSVGVTRDGAEIVLTVRDDGTGFSFRGEFSDAELRKKRLGPLSLKHRVGEAGGRIFIQSAPGGSMVEVRLPLSRGGGA